MDLMNLVDVSPFLLFESTGDSDQVEEELLGGSSSDLPTTMDYGVSDDDAESCSYDESDCSCCCVGYDDDLDEGDEHGEVEVEEEEEGEEEPPPSGCVDSAEEVVMMNEMEKSRLFWETCLAS